MAFPLNPNRKRIPLHGVHTPLVRRRKHKKKRKAFSKNFLAAKTKKRNRKSQTITDNYIKKDTNVVSFFMLPTVIFTASPVKFMLNGAQASHPCTFGTAFSYQHFYF